MNKSLCLAPWNHIQINAEGVVNPCCMFYPTVYHKKYNNLQEAFDGSENKELRQRMLNGEKIEGCHKCDLYESLNKFSYREYFKMHYDKSTFKNPKIRELEFALDNTCNFKCLTCNSRFSKFIFFKISIYLSFIKGSPPINFRNFNSLKSKSSKLLTFLTT